MWIFRFRQFWEYPSRLTFTSRRWLLVGGGHCGCRETSTGTVTVGVCAIHLWFTCRQIRPGPRHSPHFPFFSSSLFFFGKRLTGGCGNLPFTELPSWVASRGTLLCKAHSRVSKPKRDQLLSLGIAARISSRTWADSPFTRRTLPNPARQYIRRTASKSSFEELFDLKELTVPLTGVCTPLLVLGNLGIAPTRVSEEAVTGSSSSTAGAARCSCSGSSHHRFVPCSRRYPPRIEEHRSLLPKKRTPFLLCYSMKQPEDSMVQPSMSCTGSCNSVGRCKGWTSSPVSVQVPRSSRRSNNIGLIMNSSALATWVPLW